MFRLPHTYAERLLFVLCGLILVVSGCSQTPQVSEPSTPAKKKAETVEYGQFAPETLYALLVAELAADRSRFDISLGNYSQQAQKTRDPAIAERATYLAGYLGARQATLSNAMLWAEVDPDNTKARLIYANELSQVGKLSKAFKEALPLLSTSSSNAQDAAASGMDIFQSIAAKSQGLSQLERASLLKDYDTALNRYPNQAELMVGKGLLLSYQNEHQQALNIGEAVLNANPEHVGAVTLATQSLQQLGRSDDAIQLFERTLKNHPDNHDIRARYARALITVDKEKSKAQFIKLHKIAPTNPDYLLALSLIYLDEQAYTDAKHYLTQLLQQPNPDHQSTAHYYLGEIAARTKEPGIALEHYQAVGPGADFVPAISRAVRLLFMANNSEKVGDYFDELRQKYAYLSERLFLLEAQTLQQYQQVPLSLSILEQGLATFPESVSLLFSRAMTYGSLGKNDNMEADLARVIQKDENHAPALNALGYAWADKAIKLKEAKALITRALALRPEEAAYIDSMGWVEYRLGRFESAIKQLNKAMSLQPDHEIAAHLGEVLWVTGQTDAAYAAWQKGLSLKPGSTSIKNTLLRLTGKTLSPPLTANTTKKDNTK